MSEYIYRSNGEPLVNECGEILLARAGEVVRCRDCKHFTPWQERYMTDDWCHRFAHEVEPDGFCAWGERLEP